MSLNSKPGKLALTIAVAGSLGNATLTKAETIDVLALYTDEAQLADPAAAINADISYANTVTRNSGVDLQFRVVHMQKIDFPGDGSSSGQALQNLGSNRTVNQLRETHGADLVTLVTARLGGICGVGFLPSGNPQTGQLSAGADRAAYSVVGAGCNTAMIHEFGHNMSLGHSFAQRSSGGVWPWARGHGVQGSFTTVMAYPSAYRTFRRAPYFSNPELVECQGQRCGKAIEASDGANAALALNRLATQIRDFRESKQGSGGNNNNPPPANDTEAPSAPTGLRMANSSTSSITIDWRASTDNVGVAGYDVIRNGAVIASVNDTQYSDQGLQSGQSHRYSVVAFDKAGNRSAGSTSIVAATREQPPQPPADTAAPSVPIGLRSIKVTGTEIELAWQASSDNVGVAGYAIYRDSLRIGSSRLARYSDAGLQPGTRYNYRVLAIDNAGNRSALSQPLVVSTEQVVQPPGGGNPANNLLGNGDFSQGRAGWFGFLGRLYIGSDPEAAAQGGAHAVIGSRVHPLSGLIRNISTLLDGGQRYRVSARLRQNSSRAQPGNIYIVYLGKSGTQWKKIATDTVGGMEWVQLSGEFEVPGGQRFRRAYLVINGPERGVHLGVDDMELLATP